MKTPTPTATATQPAPAPTPCPNCAFPYTPSQSHPTRRRDGKLSHAFCTHLPGAAYRRLCRAAVRIGAVEVLPPADAAARAADEATAVLLNARRARRTLHPEVYAATTPGAQLP